MRRPFVVRVQADDAALARSIARALVSPLQERGARVVFDGAHVGGGTDCGVHLITGARGLPGVSLRIGVWDDNDGARWLAPLDVPSEPEPAASRAITFLETWGFVGVRRATVKST